MQREEESQMHFTESGEYKTPPYDNRVHYDVHFYAHISHFFPLSLSLQSACSTYIVFEINFITFTVKNHQRMHLAI